MVASRQCESLQPCRSRPAEVGFIDFVVMPAFQEFARLLPYASKCVDRLKENRELWSQQPDERHKAKIVGYKGLFVWKPSFFNLFTNAFTY